MQQELKKSTLKTLNAEERAHQMDQLLAEEEGKVVLLEKELSTLREKQFKKAQEVHDFKKSQQNMEAEIQVWIILDALYACIYIQYTHDSAAVICI